MEGKCAAKFYMDSYIVVGSGGSMQNLRSQKAVKPKLLKPSATQPKLKTFEANFQLK